MYQQIPETESLTLKVIAKIHTDFPAKFGIPRQSGLANTKGIIIFEPEYRHPDALGGIEDYSYLWLLWGFSENKNRAWHATSRPPRLGGNEHIGVFACRSPYRPNPIGLSNVSLDRVEISEEYGKVLHVSGVDMLDGTPIYDIKPYLPYVDSHPDAKGGFAEERKEDKLDVVIQESIAKQIPAEHIEVLTEILSQDPRPSYQNDPERIYGMKYAGMEIKFRVYENILEVTNIEKILT